MSEKVYKTVMAIFPNARGFAYAVFEAPRLPIDWGTSDARGPNKNAFAIRRIDQLMSSLEPDVVVLRAMADLQAPRGKRLYLLVRSLKDLAKTKGITMVEFTRKEVQRTFSYLDVPTRYAIVQSIVKHIPDFDPYVPPLRQIWKTEDRRMGIFDAAALALTFYRHNPAF